MHSTAPTWSWHPEIFQQNNQEVLVRGGGFLTSAMEVSNLIIAVSDDAPVYLSDVATVADGMAEPDSYTRLRFGPAEGAAQAGKEYQAVHIAVSKKKGTNAVSVAKDVIAKLHSLQGDVIPDDIQVRVTRNYGETANHKVNELITPPGHCHCHRAGPGAVCAGLA